MAMALRTRTFWHRAPEVPRVKRDFDWLLERIRRRHYPQTMSALASYWLGTICGKGYTQTEWRALDALK